MGAPTDAPEVRNYAITFLLFLQWSRLILNHTRNIVFVNDLARDVRLLYTLITFLFSSLEVHLLCMCTFCKVTNSLTKNLSGYQEVWPADSTLFY